MKSTKNTVSQRFCGKGKDEQAAVSRQLWAWADDVLPRLERRISRDCSDVRSVASDMATEAYDYAVQGILSGRVEMPESAQGLYVLSLHNAEMRIKNAYRQSKLDHGRRSVYARISVDEIVGDDESNDFTLADIAAIGSWQKEVDQDRACHLGRIALMTLEKVMELKRYGDSTRRIFKAIILDDDNREDVAQRFATSRNNCDQIVNRVKKALREYGPAIFKELLAAA